MGKLLLIAICILCFSSTSCQNQLYNIDFDEWKLRCVKDVEAECDSLANTETYKNKGIDTRLCNRALELIKGIDANRRKTLLTEVLGKFSIDRQKLLKIVILESHIPGEVSTTEISFILRYQEKSVLVKYEQSSDMFTRFPDKTIITLPQVQDFESNWFQNESKNFNTYIIFSQFGGDKLTELEVKVTVNPSIVQFDILENLMNNP